MIRPLRQRHRRVFAVLCVALPTALAVGIASRKPVPAVAALPEGLSANSLRLDASLSWRDDLFSKVPVRVAWFQEPAGGRFNIALSASPDFTRPDLLVYWIEGTLPADRSIPEHAILLGSFSGSQPMAFPIDGPQPGGALVLYSLAQNTIIEISNPVSF